MDLKLQKPKSNPKDIQVYNKLCPTSRLPHSYGPHLKYGVFRNNPIPSRRPGSNTGYRVSSAKMESEGHNSNVPIVIISPRPERKILSRLTLSEVMHVDIKPPAKNVFNKPDTQSRWQYQMPGMTHQMTSTKQEEKKYLSSTQYRT